MPDNKPAGLGTHGKGRNELPLAGLRNGSFGISRSFPIPSPWLPLAAPGMSLPQGPNHLLSLIPLLGASMDEGEHVSLRTWR